MKSFFRSKKFLSLIFIVYLIITGVMASRHIPWRDESQSWLLARDLSATQLLSQAHFEGCPPLWHLILHPFAALGAPFEVQQVLVYLIMATAIFLLLFKSPLPLYAKILAPFSFYFIFQYPVVSRHYALMTLCLFFVALFYQQRFKRPILYALLVSLLTWSGVQTALVGSLLALLFLIEIIKKYRSLKKIPSKHYLAISLMGLASLAVFLMLYPRSDGQMHGSLIYLGWNRALEAFIRGLFAFFNDFSALLRVYLGLSFSLLVSMLIALRNNTSRLVLLLSFAWLSFIFTFKLTGLNYHYGMFFVFFLFSWWLGRDGQPANPRLAKVASFIIGFAFLTSAIYGAYSLCLNYRYPYSNSRLVANYIKENNLSDKPIISFADHFASALLPYLPGKDIFLSSSNKNVTFITWDRDWLLSHSTSVKTKKKNALNYATKLNPVPDSVLVVTNFKLTDPDFTLLIQNEGRVVTDENIRLYELKIPSPLSE
ncbi:MAG: hypothetical protein ACOX0C_00960 [Patescibacteria group bacterium]|jgi:hypothetical protein